MGARTAKILVTGGAGYIGSHVCKALAVAGYEPVAYDDLSRGHRWAVRWGPLEIGDVADSGRIAEVVARHRPAALMHFAGLTSVQESIREPLLYFQNNIAASAALVGAVVRSHLMPVVFSSTAAIYGAPKATPIPEDQPAAPINPYGFSKYAVERLLLDAAAAHDLRSVSLRYFNAAGADPDGQIGESHDPETHLIPLVLAAAKSGAAVSIYGDDYDTPDGTCIRDYVHVADIAAAHVAALDYLLAGNPTATFNLANARGYSVREVIAAAEEVCGRPVKATVAPRREGDPAILVGSAARARDRLKWQPHRSELKTQIADAWNWMQSRGADDSTKFAHKM